MEVNFNFEELKQKIEYATKKSFQENFEKYNSDICAFALVSDDGAMTVVPFINTKSHLNKMILEDPDYKNSYEFEPDEWFTSEGANSEFNEICKTLSKQIFRGDIDFKNFKITLFETCVQVLEKLRLEKFFEQQLGKDLLIRFSISDTDEPKEHLIKWTKRLNNKEISSRFTDYVNTEYE